MIFNKLPNLWPYHFFQLDNGLKLHVVENHQAPIFTFQAWFKIGSRDEKLDLKITGLAHLFEHMMFRGTKRFGDGELDRLLSQHGGQEMNATTWFDRTNYFASLPKEHLELVLDLESDRVTGLVINHKLLETEKGAVLSEFYMCQDDPDIVLNDKLYEASYTTHPYRFSTIGTKKEIESFSVTQATYFYQKFYAPNNASLFIVGDVKPEEVFTLVKKYYRNFKSQKLPSSLVPKEPKQTKEKNIFLKHHGLIDPKLKIAYHTPETFNPDQAPLWVLLAILTLGRSSLLQQAWVDAGLASQIDGDLDRFQDPGLLTLNADLLSKIKPGQLIEKLDDILNQIQTEKIDLQDEIIRAKNQILLDQYEEWETNSSLATFMGEFSISTGDPLYGFQLIKQVSQVTLQDVLRVLQEYLIPTNRTILVATR